MAKIIPQLIETTGANDEDLIVLQQGNRTKKITVENFLKNSGGISNIFITGEIYFGDPATAIIRMKAENEKIYFQLQTLGIWENLSIIERV